MQSSLGQQTGQIHSQRTAKSNIQGLINTFEPENPTTVRTSANIMVPAADSNQMAKNAWLV
jgi:hypothetical protein